MTALIRLEDVTVDLPTRSGVLRALDTVSFSIQPGEIVGLVGESGSGKSMTARSILRILPPSALLRGRIMLRDLDLVAAGRRVLEDVRGSRVAMVFQEPGASLNPVMRVGDQLCEVLRFHRGMRGEVARAEASRLLEQVGIPEPDRQLRAHPHELSGGMKQRVSIAIAFACAPELLIADEPTTALDVTIQAQILQLLRDLASESGTALLMISHDLGVVGQVTDRVFVMYAGRLVEVGETPRVLASPSHPYTEALLAAAPSLDSERGARLYEIEGSVPDLTSKPAGCSFHPRCKYSFSRCSEEVPELVPDSGDGRAACFLRYSS